VAEGVGFEPTLRFPVNTLSKRAPSATRPPLLIAALTAASSCIKSRGVHLFRELCQNTAFKAERAYLSYFSQ
jgi:hypothetical protein